MPSMFDKLAGLVSSWTASNQPMASHKDYKGTLDPSLGPPQAYGRYTGVPIYIKSVPHGKEMVQETSKGEYQALAGLYTPGANERVQVFVHPETSDMDVNARVKHELTHKMMHDNPSMLRSLDEWSQDVGGKGSEYGQGNVWKLDVMGTPGHEMPAYAIGGSGSTDVPTFSDKPGEFKVTGTEHLDFPKEYAARVIQKIRDLAKGTPQKQEAISLTSFLPKENLPKDVVSKTKEYWSNLP